MTEWERSMLSVLVLWLISFIFFGVVVGDVRDLLKDILKELRKK